MYLLKMVHNMSLKQRNITIASTFSADPVEDSVRFWLERLQLSHSVNFAAPFQLIQHLLNSESLLAINVTGVNVILLRWEDLVAENTDDKRGLSDFVEALDAYLKRHTTPTLVISCPSTDQLGVLNCEQFTAWDMTLKETVVNQPNIRIVSADDLQTRYQLKPDEILLREQIGHIPFSPETFSAIGTHIARYFHSVNTTPYKVIILDCDETLWSGICGEDGPLGVQVDQQHHQLQQFMVEQRERGALLCLCSRNNEEDVIAVFNQRTEMPLKLDHFAAAQINWEPKSDNILALTEQLGLSAGSVIFLDDNPVECELVRQKLPSVLTLQLPSTTEEYYAFLQRVWAFDRSNTTDEDRMRASYYQNAIKRDAARDASPSLRAFLEGLELAVSFFEINDENLRRASQLTFRVNQFNTSACRYSESELHSLLADTSLNGLLVGVRDRFGDYGLSGLMLFSRRTDALEIDSFLLSCRALGRGVEHRMLNKLAELALAVDLSNIEVKMVPNARNQPAIQFFETEFSDCRDPATGNFQVPVGLALALRHELSDSTKDSDSKRIKSKPREEDSSDTTDNVAFTSNRAIQLAEIASQMVNAEKIQREVNDWRQRQRPETLGSYGKPQTGLEQQIAAIWSDVLGLDTVGRQDNFFELGGDSLAMVRIIVQLYDATQIEFQVEEFFTYPTIEMHAIKLSAKIAGKQGDLKASDL